MVSGLIVPLLRHGPDVNKAITSKACLGICLAAGALAFIGCTFFPQPKAGRPDSAQSRPIHHQYQKDQRIFNLSKGEFDAQIIHSGKGRGDLFANDRSQIGYSLLCADLNGDGIEDIVVGAPPPVGLLRHAHHSGLVYVLLGKRKIPRIWDLARADWILYMPKSQMSTRFGHSLAAGDLNGDGIQDLMIGAPYANTVRKKQFRAGEVYVVFGRKQFSGTQNILRSADLIVSGHEVSQEAGFALSSGDINGDGLDDLLIGAPGANRNGKVMAGHTYVIFGRKNFPRKLSLSTGWDVRLVGVDGPNSYFVNFDHPPDRSGSALAVGDINHDGLKDIIIGAPFANGPDNDRTGAGEVYVVFGRKRFPRNIELEAEADLTFWGALKHGHAGFSLGIGDVNGDQVDDLVMGTADSREPDEKKPKVAAFMVYGRKGLPHHVDLRNEADRILTDSEAVVEAPQNPIENVNRGYPVAAVDFNQDGLADVLLGAPSSIQKINKTAYLVWGKKRAPRWKNLNRDFDGIIFQQSSVTRGKPAVAAGDVNGDGWTDLLIRAGDPKGDFGKDSIFIILGKNLSPPLN